MKRQRPEAFLRLLLLLILGLASPHLAAAAPDDAAQRALVARVLQKQPVIDGHNDLPWELRERFASLSAVDLSKPTGALLSKEGTPLMTDIPRLRAGGVGGQFWSVWIPPTVSGPEAIRMTLEQIDLVDRMVLAYPKVFALARSAEEIRRIEAEGKIACLIGVEGGHQIDGSPAALRQFYALGARYMTLTHTKNTALADSATDDPQYGGLSPYGATMVREMNRVGMLVDLSHVSADAMRGALRVSSAPVIFSHSSARALVDHPRDVPDDVLKRLRANGGVVMVNFAPTYVSDARRRWDADRNAEKARYDSPPYGGLYIGQPDRAAAALAAWDAAHPAPEVSIKDVADHIDHIRSVAGAESVGIGSDFDGIPSAPTGLAGVSDYPKLLLELARRGWSEGDLEKLTGGNILRVLAAAEAERDRRREEPPLEAEAPVSPPPR